jgi:hypothetical protein
MKYVRFDALSLQSVFNQDYTATSRSRDGSISFLYYIPSSFQ